MISWAPRRRARMERIEAEAEALISELGDRAYHEARRREHEASADEIADDWAHVARAIALKTGSRIGLNLSTQLEMNTFFVLDREAGEARESHLDWQDEPKPRPEPSVLSPQPFRIQFPWEREAVEKDRS